jgi:hypothetical protein
MAGKYEFEIMSGTASFIDCSPAPSARALERISIDWSHS